MRDHLLIWAYLGVVPSRHHIHRSRQTALFCAIAGTTSPVLGDPAPSPLWGRIWGSVTGPYWRQDSWLSFYADGRTGTPGVTTLKNPCPEFPPPIGTADYYHGK